MRPQYPFHVGNRLGEFLTKWIGFAAVYDTIVFGKLANKTLRYTSTVICFESELAFYIQPKLRATSEDTICGIVDCSSPENL